MDCEPDSYDEEVVEWQAEEAKEAQPKVQRLTAGKGCDCCSDESADVFVNLTLGWTFDGVLCKECAKELSIAFAAIFAAEAQSRGG